MVPRRIDGLLALEAPKDQAPGSVLAIGNFDGVHLGHQAVIRSAAAQARKLGLRFYVLTFDPSPTEVLGKRQLACLTPLGRKLELLSAIDPDVAVIVEPFTLALSQHSAEDFVRDFLVARARPKLILVGSNFCFGRGREGNLAVLEGLGVKYGFEARAEALRGDDAGAYSSTRIRALVAAGALDRARAMLGRPHAVSGPVVLGDRRGRRLGFPTANLQPTAELLPPHGVYACLVDEVDATGSGAGRLALGVMNLGVRPTVGAGPSLEVHLLDYSGDLYGKVLRVHLIERLRDEQRFDDVAALTAQITHDIDAARESLRAEKPNLAAGSPWY